MDFHRWGVGEFVTTGSLMEPPGACSPQPSFWVLMNNQKLLMWCAIILLAQCPGKVGLFSVHTPGAVKGGVRTALWLGIGSYTGEEGRLMWLSIPYAAQSSSRKCILDTIWSLHLGMGDGGGFGRRGQVVWI